MNPFVVLVRFELTGFTCPSHALSIAASGSGSASR